MSNFRAIVFIRTQTYRKIFKSTLVMKNILVITFSSYLINSPFYGGIWTKLDWYRLSHSFFSFEVYSVNKQINKIMNRPKYNPQGMNDKKSQPLTGNANNIKTSKHPN